MAEEEGTIKPLPFSVASATTSHLRVSKRLHIAAGRHPNDKKTNAISPVLDLASPDKNQRHRHIERPMSSLMV